MDTLTRLLKAAQIKRKVMSDATPEIESNSDINQSGVISPPPQYPMNLARKIEHYLAIPWFG